MRRYGKAKDWRSGWRVTYRVVLGIAGVGAAFTLSYLIQTWLASRFGWPIGWRVRSYWGQYLSHITTVALGLVLLIVAGTIAGRIVAPRQHALWQSVTDAFRRMAQGNFDVHLDVDMIREPGGEQHPFRVLVHSINDMAQELGQLERMRQEFISNVSHEIQSPLTSITGFASALKHDDVPEEQRQRYLDIIESESLRLSRLSDNLLKLTSLESGYHPFRPETYRLDRQLRDCVLALEPVWAGKLIQLDIAVPIISFYADKDLINQVWVNILTNAIKFTPHQGCISISAEVSIEQVVVRIADSGIGLSETDGDRIFERFYKADKARTRGVSGAGLGLSIVKKILELHEGTIEVDSAPGVGSTFTVSLPTSTAASPNLHPVTTRGNVDA
jgi:two-component system, OmpR family, phosphate regulon sensor histidine kinase PhoR